MRRTRRIVDHGTRSRPVNVVVNGVASVNRIGVATRRVIRKEVAASGQQVETVLPVDATVVVDQDRLR